MDSKLQNRITERMKIIIKYSHIFSIFALFLFKKMVKSDIMDHMYEPNLNTKYYILFA